MSSEAVEQTVKSILPFIEDYFIGLARERFSPEIDSIEFSNTQTHERRGVTGRVLVSQVTFTTEFGSDTTTIALKFFEDKESAISEMKNAMELDIKFKTVPEFGVPTILFASTRDPILIIYEGVSGTNYDELDLPNKALEAGRLLASIHGPDTKRVDTNLYRDLIRMLGQQLSVIGKEQEISTKLRTHFEKMEGSMSGCNPFSDFHQSNVMMTHYEDEIFKSYVIDPEYMQKGQFDRLEDVGTFFGGQLFHEFRETGDITTGLNDIEMFLKGYQDKLEEMGGSKWTEMYSNGCPLSFFLAQWALMDALDFVLNRGGSLKSQPVNSRVNFALFILSGEKIKFPNDRE